MRIERLNENNFEAYIIYLKKAMSIEPDMMTAEKIDEDGIRKRIMDSFYQKTTSLLAIDNEINQYYLIRSINTEADRFYHSFEAASLSEAPILRKKL